MSMTLTPAQRFTLVDRKDEYIETWTRELIRHEKIGPLNLTARQRRVIASLHWWREVCKSNSEMERDEFSEQPPPLAGTDARGRPVVQQLDKFAPHSLRMWALTKEGEPADIKEPVISVKTGERVPVPEYARSRS